MEDLNSQLKELIEMSEELEKCFQANLFEGTELKDIPKEISEITNILRNLNNKMNEKDI